MEAYLDNGATTRCYPEVADLIRKTLLKDYGNPSSLHRKGVEAEQYIRRTTEILADILKVNEREIYYTSGGTESNNWALAGTAMAHRRTGGHFIISAVEHPAVSAPASALHDMGFDLTVLPVDREGRVHPEELRQAVRKDTLLVSVMMVNNEIGTIEPIEEIARIVHETNPDTVFHVDAIQAFGKCRILPGRLGIDMLSASGHKIHGPKGVGFLYVNDRVRLRPLIYGGGQQSGMRSGTDNVPGIAGLGLAARMMYDHLEENRTHMYALRKRLADGLSGLDQVVIHGPSDPAEAAPHILNASFLKVRSEVLLHALEDRGIYVSAGSACSSHKRSGSPTLTAVRCPREEMESAVRFSFSDMTRPEEIDYTLEALRELLPALRRFTRR